MNWVTLLEVVVMILVFAQGFYSGMKWALRKSNKAAKPPTVKLTGKQLMSAFDANTQNADYMWYKTKEHELRKEHLNEFVVIRHRRILGFYMSAYNAYQDTVETYRPGTFIIQKVGALPVQIFHN